jgi:hypothetical protein
MEILDANGQVIRREQVNSHAGLNRATWDLSYERPHVVALRTLPPGNPHIWEDSRFRGKNTRPIIHWGIEGAQGAAPIAAPGKYSVRMTLDGQTLTQPFEVLKDPAIDSSDADLVASTQMQIKVRNDQNEAADMVNRLEVMRKEIEDQLAAVKGNAAREKQLRDRDKRLMDVELMLITKADMQSDDKYYPEQYKVYMNLVWFKGVIGLGAGDVQGGAEYKPTDVSTQILNGIETDLAAAKQAYARVTDTASSR